MTKLDKYIKNKQGDKVPKVTTSINLELRHTEFLKRRNLNLSLIIRDYIDKLIRETTDDTDLL